MIFIDKMKNLKLYKTQSFLPTLKNNKKKGSAILLMSPNYEASKRLMNNKMFVNSNRFSSYYLEKDVSYYIGSKVLEEVDESAIINEQFQIDEILEETKRSELPDSAFGVPSKRKFPLDTEAHVRSAIKFFNYVDPEDEEELARRIKAAMKKFGINDVHVSEKNRFSKYYKNPEPIKEWMTILENVYKNPEIERTWFVPDSVGRENACVKIKGFDKPLRGRSELLIIKGDSVYLVVGKKGFASTKNLTYEVPGGAWDKGETHDFSAKREAREESFLNVSGNPIYGSNYTLKEKTPRAWVVAHVKANNWWFGYYTEVYVGRYSGKFTGEVAKHDQEKAMTKGDWYKIDEVYDKLHPAHRKAIDAWRAVQNGQKPEEVQKESVDELPNYHNIFAELDILYYAWKNGTIAESVAKERILQMLKNNLCLPAEATVNDVPSIHRYFAGRGLVNESFEEPIPHEDFLTENLINHLPSGALNLGDKVIFFNESNANDAQLKRLLFKDRLKKRREVLDIYEKVKNDNPWIKFAFPELSKYVKKNVFVDLYYYNALFFENNKWIQKRGFNLYLDFLTRTLNHPNLKAAGYSMQTIFVPVKEWDKTHDGMIWNYRKSLNPISCIYQMMFDGNLNGLKKVFGSTNIIFLADDKYFKINFEEIDAKDLKRLAIKFKLFVIKICKGEEFDLDDIDTTADHKDDADVIAAKIVDKIELAKGVDLTKHVAKAVDAKEIKKKEVEKLTKAGKLPPKDKKLTVTPGTSQAKDTIKKVKDEIIDNFEDIDDEADYDNGELEDIEKAQDAQKLADAIAYASDAESEEDALDTLDNDEIKDILVNLGSDDEVNISASRSTRMTKLDQELLNKEINGRTINDILTPKEKKEEELLTVDVASPNTEEWKDLSFVNLDKDYDIDRDIISMFRKFSTCTRPMVIKDIKVTDNSTSEDRLALYDVQMEDYKGRRFRIKLDIPIMEDNRFLLRGDYKSIQTQFFNMPIIKTETDTCQLISNYKKIFLYRFGDNRGRSLPAVAKFLKACSKYAGTKLKIEVGNNSKVCDKYNLPMDYIDLATNLSRIESSDFIIFFNQDEIREKYVVDDTKGIPYIYNKKAKEIEYFVYYNSDFTFISELCRIIFEFDKNFEDLFSSVTRASGCGYVRASIMSQKIPVVVLCAYHVGLRNTMDRIKMKYEVVEKLTKEIRSDVNKDWIEFEDGFLVYDVNYESSMLMSGLKIKSCPTEMFSVNDIDNKNMYLEFLDNFGGRIIADGLDNFYDLFVDPMIKDSLEYYSLPTDYIDILLYGSALLADNKYIKHVDTTSRRMRRYQLISVYTYQVLSRAYGIYSTMDKHTNSPSFAVKQSEVVDAFLTDTITSDDSFLNALRDVETTNAITTKGPSGMNADRAYTLDKRSYDESMVNVLGMSTGFAGNVGITRQTTINPEVTADGYVKDVKGKNMNDASSLTATENLIPFGSTRDDPMRTAMSFIQTSKHMVRTEDSDPLLVTSGADEVMPYLTTNRFAYKAKWDGVVLEVTDSYMLVQKSGDTKTKDYINLEETIEKNSDGGYYVPLKLDAAEGMKKNVKFKKDQVLAYDHYSFSNKLGESNNIAYNIGKLAKVAILNTDEGFEDSGVISQKMAQKLATRVNLKYDCIIDKDSKIYKMLKVGDHVEASDDLIIWENAFDDESAASVMDAISKGSEFSDIGKRKLKSEVTGTITDIRIYRTVEVDELSPSIKKIVNAYEKPIKEKAKFLEENGITGKKLPAHTKLAPTGKLKKSQDAIFVEFYVEYLDTVGVGVA